MTGQDKPKPPTDDENIAEMEVAHGGWQQGRRPPQDPPPQDPPPDDPLAETRPSRLQVLGPEPIAPCVQCGINDGKVYLIRNNFGDNLRAQPLHEHCAPFWFKLR